MTRAMSPPQREELESRLSQIFQTQSEDQISMYLYGTARAVSSVLALAHLIFMCPCVCGNQVTHRCRFAALRVPVD